MSSRHEEPEQTIPVVVEEPVVGKAIVEQDRVRVHKRVVTEPVLVDAEEVREDVLVERVPVDRMVDGPLPVRTDGDVTVVPVVEEVVVVQKRFVLREEIRLTRRRTARPRTLRAEVRREVATVERVAHQPGTRR